MKPVTLLILGFLFASLLICLAREQTDSLIQAYRIQLPDEPFIDSLTDRAYRLRNRHPEAARRYSDIALQLAEKIHYVRGLGNAHFRIAFLLKRGGEMEDALHHYQQSLVFRSERQDSAGMASALNSIGSVLTSMRQFTDAWQSLMEGLEIRKKLGRLSSIGSSHKNLGILYASMEEYAEAIRHFEKCLHIYTSLSPQREIADAYNNLGSVFFEQGDYAQALRYYEEALRLKERSSDMAGRAGTLMNIGNCYKLLDTYADARIYFNRALHLQDSLDARLAKARTYCNLGLLHELEENYLLALDYYKQCFSIANQEGEKGLFWLAAKNISLTYTAIDSFDEAIVYKQIYEPIQAQMEDSKFVAVQQRDKLREEAMQHKLSLVEARMRHRLFRERISQALAGIFLLLGLGVFYFIKTRNKQKIAAIEKDREVSTLAAMLDGRLEEQRRISNEIHSGLCSSLNAIRNEFSMILNKLDMIPAELKERFSFAMDELTNAGKDARRYSHKLAPVVLEKFGLVDGMQEEARKINRGGNALVEIMNFGLEGRLEKRIERNTYLILMELLQNALKYAEAKEISIQFHRRNGTLNATYEDDGVGFDPKLAHQQGGKGLTSMQILAKQMRGTFNIESKTGEGTTAILELPLKVNGQQQFAAG